MYTIKDRNKLIAQIDLHILLFIIQCFFFKVENLIIFHRKKFEQYMKMYDLEN